MSMIYTRPESWNGFVVNRDRLVDKWKRKGWISKSPVPEHCSLLGIDLNRDGFSSVPPVIKQDMALGLVRRFGETGYVDFSSVDGFEDGLLLLDPMYPDLVLKKNGKPTRKYVVPTDRSSFLLRVRYSLDALVPHEAPWALFDKEGVFSSA